MEKIEGTSIFTQTVKILLQVQGGATKVMKGLEIKTYEEQRKGLGMISQEMIKWRFDNNIQIIGKVVT